MKLFYSYSHYDSDLRVTLETHLTILKRQNVISTWSDRNINAGQDWVKKIDKNLLESDIVLLGPKTKNPENEAFSGFCYFCFGI